MTDLSRRRFVTGSVAAMAAFRLLERRALAAAPLGLPLGLQLFSVREQMAQDLAGTLAAVRAAGYVEVEAAALPKLSAREMRAALDKAGLRCVSAHHSFLELQGHLEAALAFDQELGVKYLICASPGYRNQAAPGPTGQRPVTLDDWHYNAEEFNKMGMQTAKAGVRFGYHNHTREFRMTEGQMPLRELLRLTEPRSVTFEMDCGWVKAAGADPIELMRKYPRRFSMLHVKDFTLPQHPSAEKHDEKVTELGRGTIDYAPLFAEARRTQKLEHAFVEQEAFDMPWKESLKVDAEYLQALKV